MIVEPPGEPTVRNGLPSRVMIVGDIDERGRLPPSTRFGCVVESKLKSVSSLLSRKPQPGTSKPEPPVDSIVNVYETTLPHLSDVTRCVVVSDIAAVAAASPFTYGYGSPGCTAPGAAVAVINARRWAAYSSDSRPLSGTS